MYFDQSFLRKIIPDSFWIGAEAPEDFSFSIDSRTLTPGQIFVALPGTRVDGHAFVNHALQQDAGGLMIAHEQKALVDALKPEFFKKKFVILVPDVRQAFIDLAGAWRAQFKIPVVGITGSVGKTSTKEILSQILKSQGQPFVASAGNQNTEIGSALNIFKMRLEHKAAVFEMGINKRGEMARSAFLIKPTIGIITTIGHSHMEGLGSLTDISAEKRDIFKYFQEDNIGIINGDLPILSGISYTHPVIRFGCKMVNQVQARKIQTHGAHVNFVLKLYNESYRIALATSHTGRVMNTLAAVAAAHLLGVPHDIIVKAIQEPLTVTGRFETCTLKRGKGTLINDCYNASPESMKAALLAFEKLETSGQKIAVLGDMLELGVTSQFWHRQLGRLLRKAPSIRHVLFVGDQVKWAQKTVPVGVDFSVVPSWREAVTYLNEKLESESIVLVKGSLGMGLAQLVHELADVGH